MYLWGRIPRGETCGHVSLLHMCGDLLLQKVQMVDRCENGLDGFSASSEGHKRTVEERVSSLSGCCRDGQ